MCERKGGRGQSYHLSYPSPSPSSSPCTQKCVCASLYVCAVWPCFHQCCLSVCLCHLLFSCVICPWWVFVYGGHICAWGAYVRVTRPRARAPCVCMSVSRSGLHSTALALLLLALECFSLFLNPLSHSFHLSITFI